MGPTLNFLHNLEVFLNKYEITFTLFISIIGAVVTGAVGIISLFIALYTTNKSLNFEKEKQKLASIKLMSVLELESEELRRSINTVNLDYLVGGLDEDIIFIKDVPLLYLELTEKNTLEDIQQYIKLLKDFRNKNLSELTNNDSNKITQRLRILDSLTRRVDMYLSYYNDSDRINLLTQSNKKISIKPIRKEIQQFIDLATKSFV